MDLLELNSACVKYGDALALEDVSVHVNLAEIVAVVGRNGAGKSTLLKTLAGLLPLTSGKRSFRGADVTHLNVERMSRSGVALVPDTRRIFPNLTVGENLRIGTLAHKCGHWTMDRVLHSFPALRKRLDFSGDQLSGGEQQMLAVARALLSNPSLLLLDEPTEGLAPLLVDQLIEVFREVHKQGTGIVLVEQNLKVPMKLAHRQYVLDHGQVVWAGTASEVAQHRQLLENMITTGPGSRDRRHAEGVS